jgi:hypothetical protein
MLNNRGARTLHFGSEPRSQAWSVGLVVAHDALKLRGRLRAKFENEAHRPGAI